MATNELGASVLILILVLSGAIGFVAQYIGLCMVRGVKEASAGKPVFLLAIVLSGTLAWIPALLAPIVYLKPAFSAHSISQYAIFGGLLFGAGAAFNGGCSVSTIGRLTRGELIMVFTVLGWLFGWFVEINFITSTQPSEFIIPTSIQYPALIILSIILGILLLTKQKQNIKVWFSMLAIGLIGGVLLIFEPNWTPSGLLKDISHSLWEDDRSSMLGIERYAIVVSLIIGMIIAAKLTNRFQLQMIRLRIVPRHLLAGMLMGIGGSMAAGGNDTQLLSALPSISPAGIVTVLSIIVGIYLTNTYMLNGK